MHWSTVSVAEEDGEVVADELAAAAGEDGRSAGETCLRSVSQATRCIVNWKNVSHKSLGLVTVLIALVAATALPIPAMADDLRCTALYDWDFDGNGFGGTLHISVDGGGNLAGTVYGDPIRGFYNNVSNEMMFIRSAGGSTDPASQQVFTGYYWQEGLLDVLAGSYEAFSGTGASAGRHRFGFKASCMVIP